MELWKWLTTDALGIAFFATVGGGVVLAILFAASKSVRTWSKIAFSWLAERWRALQTVRLTTTTRQKETLTEARNDFKAEQERASEFEPQPKFIVSRIGGDRNRFLIANTSTVTCKIVKIESESDHAHVLGDTIWHDFPGRHKEEFNVVVSDADTAWAFGIPLRITWLDTSGRSQVKRQTIPSPL